MENIKQYRSQCRVEPERWVNIGYARKSPSKESTTTRIDLLEAMVKKLKTKLLCSQMFVSYSSTADSPFESRDSNPNQHSVSYANGNTNGKTDCRPNY